MEAYIYDAVRTPRGRGKADGSLHEITPIQLATQVLEAVRDRNQIDTADVDDVILGCVSPVGDRARCSAQRRLCPDRTGRSDQSLLRVGA